MWAWLAWKWVLSSCRYLCRCCYCVLFQGGYSHGEFDGLFMTVLEYPRFLRFLLSWSSILAKFSGSELVLRNLVASPTMMPLPIPGGWYESCLMYSCLFACWFDMCPCL